MDYYEAVASQPANLERSAMSVRKGLADVDLSPWRSGTLAVASMGASTHAGHALVDRLLRYGRRAVNLDASSLMLLGDHVEFADSYVFISEGGRSRETVDAARRVPEGTRLGLTNEPVSPFADVVDIALDLGHGEDSPVYTVGYTATLQAFGLFATALDGNDDGERWDRVPQLVAQVIENAAASMAEISGRFEALSSIDFVGRGASLASAAEAALLLRESTRTPTAAFETYQYLHGPMESLDAGKGCVIFGSQREVDLARYVAERGVPTVLVTSVAVPSSDVLTVVQLPAISPVGQAVLEIVPLQLLAGGLARLRGLGIDGFLYHQDDSKISVDGAKSA